MGNIGMLDKTGKEVGENEKGKEIDTSWEFHNVIPTFRNGMPYKYNLSLNAKTLGELFLNKTIIYDGSLQRGYKINKKGELVDIAKASKIKEILQEMISGNLHGGTIVLNYHKEFDKEFGKPLVYNEEKNTLSGELPLNVLDGQHRLKACVKYIQLYEKNKVIENPSTFEFPVTIEYLTREGASDLFNEYASKPLKISKSRADYLDINDFSNYLVKKVINNSEMRGKIDCVSTTHKGYYISTFSALISSINLYLKPATIEQANVISEYLIKFFNTLINIFPDILGNISAEQRMKMRKNNLHAEILTMYGYAAIAKNLIGENDIDLKLKKLKDKIKIGEWEGTILDRDCPIWENTIMRSKNKIVSTKSTQKLMSNIMVDYVMNDKLPVKYTKIG